MGSLSRKGVCEVTGGLTVQYLTRCGDNSNDYEHLIWTDVYRKNSLDDRVIPCPVPGCKKVVHPSTFGLTEQEARWYGLTATRYGKGTEPAKAKTGVSTDRR